MPDQYWAELLNATGKPVIIENCHWGNTVPSGEPPVSSGQNVFIGTCDGSAEQQWILTPVAGSKDLVTVVQKSSGRLLTVKDCKRAPLPRGPGGNVTVADGPDRTCGGLNQQFTFHANGTITEKVLGTFWGSLKTLTTYSSNLLARIRL